MAAYGDTDSMANYELDHLISLSWAAVRIVWLTSGRSRYNDSLGAHEKDKVENYLHDQVCSNSY